MKFIQRLFLEIVYIFENYINFVRFRNRKNSLLSDNIIWFTNCSWIDQLIAFDQISLYYYKK